MNEPNAFLTIIRMLTPEYQSRAHHKRRRRTISRQAQDWQMPSRNRLGRASESEVYNAISHIQASGTNPTISMISRLIRKDSRQVRRILKRLELAGPLSWLHHAAKYRNNRRQYVPIILRWERLRQPEDLTPVRAAVEPEVILLSSNEPTLSSTLEPTRTKSLGSKGFNQEQIQTESVNTRFCETVPATLQENSKATPPLQENPKPLPAESHAETWGTEAGFRIPDKDLEAIAKLVAVKTHAVKYEDLSESPAYDVLGQLFDRAAVYETLDRWFLAYLVETVWLRATRPEKNWKAFYAAAVLKILLSDRAICGAWRKYQRRDELWLKFKMREPDTSAWTPKRIAEYRRKAAQ
jgi:hypothetical protein